MTTRSFRGLVAAACMAAGIPTLMLSCGGSSSAPPTPADTTPPTLAIGGTSITPVAAAFTVTFTFSEDVGTSFTASDVTVTHGTAASTVVKTDATHYSLVVTPEANSTGTIQISVAAGAVADLAGNASTAAATASQPFSTVPAPTSYAVVDYADTTKTYKATDFGGDASTLPATDAPAGGPATPTVKVIKTANAESWAGTTLSYGYLDSVGSLPFSATNTKVTAVVYSPAANVAFKLKAEDAQDSTKSVESDATAAAAGWQTLTFDMATPSSGTAALSLANTYNKVSIFPNFGVRPSADQTFYVGPIKFLGATTPAAPALTAPVDTVPPTVTIGGTSATPATGAVTFTFTFSEDVGTSFTQSDVAVSGGTAGTLVRTDATHYSLAVTPPSNGTGTLTVTIAAGAFSDLANNASTAEATASQAYDTTVQQSSYAVLDFATAGLTYGTTDFGGNAATFPATDAPAGGPATPVVKLVKTAHAEIWAGTTLWVGYLDSIGTVPFSASNTKFNVVFYAPAAGLDIKLKLEDAQNGAHSVETDVTTAAAGWQTLTFDMASVLTPDKLAWTFNKLSVFPHFGTSPTADEAYYVGPITFVGASAPAAPPLAAPAVTTPTDLPPVPTAQAADVVSLYTSSGAYTNVAVDTWRTDWSSGNYSEVVVNGKTLKKYTALNYAGMEFLNPGPKLNLTGMNYMHVDLWTPDATQFSVKLVTWTTTNGPEFQVNYAAPAITKAGWVSLEIPLSSFTGVDLSSIGQLLWVDNVPNVENGTFFLDNIYFHK